MIIGPPETTNLDGRPALCAEISTSRQDLPRQLWFAQRDEASPRYSNLSDAFLVGMVPLAMKLGEDLRVEGPVSEVLAFGLDSYCQILATWYPRLFRPISVDYADLRARRAEHPPEGNACCFSGGVDSWFTALRAMAPDEKFSGFNLTHAVMINGFDQFSNLQDQRPSRAMFSAYEPFFTAQGVKLLMLDSNLKLFRDTVFYRSELACSYVCALAACVHALAPMFGSFKIPGHGSFRYEELQPSGAHPALDHHLGTRQMLVMHDTAGRTRTEKIEALLDHPEFRKSLRVCGRDLELNEDGGVIPNCGRCEKCARTIASLDILGQLERFETFSGHLPIAAYQDSRALAQTGYRWLMDNLRLAKRCGHQVWMKTLTEALNLKRESATARAGRTT